MLGKDLADLIASGARPVVTFTEGIADMENYLEKGMRGRLVGVTERLDGMFRLHVDLTEFDDFNKQFESADYYDKNQTPCLTARQAGYHTDPMESFYAMLAEPSDYLVIEEEPARFALFQQYQASGSNNSYVRWLEDQVLSI